jgi:hypothetical protein
MKENNEWKKRYEEQVSKLRNFLPEFSINDFLFIKLKESKISVKKSEAVPLTKKNEKISHSVKNAVKSLDTGKKMKNVESKKISESKFFIASKTRRGMSNAVTSFKNSKVNISAYNFIKYIERYINNPFKGEIEEIQKLLKSKSPDKQKILELMQSILSKTSADPKYKKK